MTVPGDRLKRSRVMFDPALNGAGGIDPQNLSRRYPASCLREPESWLRMAEESAPMTGAVVVQTWRNLIQNPRCIAVVPGVGVIQSADEAAAQSARPFYGVSFLSNGRLRAETFDVAAGLHPDVLQFAGGIPVLWNGRVLTVEEICSEVADFGHIWRLLKLAPDGTPTKDKATFERLRATFNQYRYSAADDAGNALLEAARDAASYGPPLDRERSYLHNAVGVRRDGGLVIVVANGSLEELGEMSRDAGAESAIVVDNGGSCAVALRNEPRAPILPLVTSHYHRPKAIAVAIYELKGEAKTTFFLGRGALAPNTAAPGRLRRPVSSVALEFATDFGILRREVHVVRLDSEAADLVALTIANFAVIVGAWYARVLAPPEFVMHVRSRYNERFRVTPAHRDLDGLRGLWMENFLTVVHDIEFRIGLDALDMSSPAAAEARPSARSVPARYALGVDIGAGNIKVMLLEDGANVVGDAVVHTRGDGAIYNSHIFSQQITEGVRQALVAASLSIEDVDRIGVCWPGAVRKGVAAHSKVLLDMSDMLPDGRLKVALFERIRRLESYLRSVLAPRPETTISVYNDGEVEVAYEAETSARTGVLLCKLGATVAGGFIDRSAAYRYLTEIGRAVIRTDSQAPCHPHSRIKGMASTLIGSIAMAREARARGLTTVDGLEISDSDAGRELDALIAANSEGAAIAREIVDEMGTHVAALLEECVFHLRDVDHILLRGGPTGDHVVGRLLRQSVQSHLPRELAAKIDQATANQFSGAFAAAWLAARGL